MSREISLETGDDVGGVVTTTINKVEEGHCPWEESEVEPEEVVASAPPYATDDVVTTPILSQQQLKTTTVVNNRSKAALVEPQVILSTEVISTLKDRSPSFFQSVMSHFRSYRELWKTNLSVLVVTTTAIGWISSGGSIVSKSFFALVCGTFLQSACANR